MRFAVCFHTKSQLELLHSSHAMFEVEGFAMLVTPKC